jgi:hypothetical protein
MSALAARSNHRKLDSLAPLGRETALSPATTAPATAATRRKEQPQNEINRDIHGDRQPITTEQLYAFVPQQSLTDHLVKLGPVFKITTKQFDQARARDARVYASLPMPRVVCSQLTPYASTTSVSLAPRSRRDQRVQSLSVQLPLPYPHRYPRQGLPVVAALATLTAPIHTRALVQAATSWFR